MPKALQIALLILIPLAWGLLVDFVFERIRRRRRRRGADPGGQSRP